MLDAYFMYITYQNKDGSVSVDIKTGKIRVMSFDNNDEWSRDHSSDENEAWSAVSGTLTNGELIQIRALANNITAISHVEDPRDFHGFGMETLKIELEHGQLNSIWNEESIIPDGIRKCAKFVKGLRSRGK